MRADRGHRALDGFDLRALGDVARLRIAAPVRITSARIVTAQDADAGAFLDAGGEPIAATITQGNMAWGAFDVPLQNGQSEVVTVPDHAATLVLKKQGREVLRIRVDLRPGDVQILRP
ncbi:MAG: hypothetical protein U1E73_07640 [Planctomycetota bacterium]